MSHSGGHLEMFISKEPEDLTRRSPVVPTTDRIIHSSVISRALANGELVNAGFDALHSLEEPHSPAHQRRLNDDALFADSEIKSEITYQNDNYTTTTLTQVPYDNSSTYTVIANAGSQRYARQYSASSPNGEYYQDINHFGNVEAYPQNNRRIVYSTSEQATEQVFIERYNVNGRQPVYKVANSVDLPSPDSGIGDGGTPRDPQVIQHANFDYGDPFSSNGLLADALRDSAPSVGSDCDDRTQPTTPLTPLTPGGSTHSGSRKAWDCSRNEPDKFQVPKVYSNYGFRYYLESPISTSQRREDDRITYINKGQFYGITLEYIPDPDRPLKSTTVKSVIMLVFREEKSTEEEQKAWAFWHGRQHSIKQRILDADTKNSAGLIAPIEEVSHNSIAVYWNPLETSGKVNIAVQCLSTDFSSQKGVKGLPLHVQVDTYDEHKDGPPCHRGYCQIKIFCDKGAERKTRDEERRAAKRKMAQSVRSKRIDELYHATCERSEFYSMADLLRQPVLFSPAEDEKVGGPLDLQGFYIEHHDLRFRGLPRNGTPAPVIEATSDVDNGFRGLRTITSTATLSATIEHAADPEIGRRTSEIAEPEMVSPPHLFNGSAIKRRRLRPPEYEAILIHVRQDGEDYFTSLYVAPPTVQGLVSAIVEKYKMSAETIRALYRKNRINGAVSRLDDNVLKHYCNEELFHMDITRTDSDGFYDVTFVELDLS